MDMGCGPNPNSLYPKENLTRICFIRHAVKNPNIIIGAYTHSDDPGGSADFQRHVTHHDGFWGDKLISGNAL